MGQISRINRSGRFIAEFEKDYVARSALALAVQSPAILIARSSNFGPKCAKCAKATLSCALGTGKDQISREIRG